MIHRQQSAPPVDPPLPSHVDSACWLLFRSTLTATALGMFSWPLYRHGGIAAAVGLVAFWLVVSFTHGKGSHDV